MSWGGSSSQDTPDLAIGGLDDEEFSTTQEAVPLPYIAGERKVAARWLSNIYNQRAVEILMDVGKKGGKTGTGSYAYYGSIAAAICCGPVEELVAIIIDTKQVWALGNVTRAASADEPYRGTIAAKGEFTFYWGTEDQVLAEDSILKAGNNNLSESHPDYKGVAFIEFRNILFGKEKVSAPNVEIIVKRKPIQNLITGTPSNLDDGQANLLCAAAELMTNERFGIRLPESLFDSATFQTVAAKLYERRELSYGSPLLHQQDSMRAFLANVGLMTDTFLLWDSTGAQIEAGYWPHGETIDPETLPAITIDDLTDPPDLDADSWTGMETGWAVSFADRDRVYKESSEKFDDISLIEVTGEPNRATLKRPFITKRSQAIAHATEWGKTKARPGLKGKITVRKTRCTHLNVGNYFRLDIEPEPGGSQLQQVFRITEITSKKVGSSTITIEAETNLVPLANTPVIPGSGDGGGAIAEPDMLLYVRPVELPPKLSNADYGIGILAQREDSMTIGFNLLYDDAADGDFPNIGTQRTFNVRASLDAALSATAKSIDEEGYDAALDAPVLDISLSNDIDLLNLADNPGLTVARDNQLLIFIIEIEDSGERAGQVKLDPDGFPMLEIMSMADMTVPAAGTRRVEVLRGRFGTVRRSFTAGAEAWFVHRDTLKIYTRNDFPSAAAAQSTCFFKTEPYNAFLSRDISGDGTVEFLFPSSRLFAPKITFTSSPASGYVGVPVSVEGSIVDQDGDLTYWSLSYRNAGTGIQDEVTVAGGPIEATDRRDFKVPIRFVESGTYEIIVRAKDNTTFTDSFVDASFQVSVSVIGELDPPAAPTDLSTTTGFLLIWLEWVNPDDDDLDYIEIWESGENDLSTAVKLTQTKTLFFAHNVETADDHYYWVRAIDTSGNVGPYNAGQYAGTLGKAKILIEGGDVDPDNIVIAYSAQIANAIITGAKISDLTVSKLTGGTIGAIEMILAADGVFKSSNYVEGESGFKLNGAGSVELLEAIIRNGTQIGGISKSSNYIEGEAGAKINWDTGAAEFWNVNIYGSVQMPQVFLDVTELVTGAEYEHESSEAPLTLTVSAFDGTTAYYRTDGLVPSGLVSELIPANNQISISANSQLRVIAFEDSTSRSSPVFSAEFTFLTLEIEFTGGDGGNYYRCLLASHISPLYAFIRGYYESTQVYWTDWTSASISTNWRSIGYDPVYFKTVEMYLSLSPSGSPAATPTFSFNLYGHNW